MQRVLPWILTFVSLFAGVASISMFHRFMSMLQPELYENDLATDSDRLLMLVLAVLAGIVGSFVVGAIAGHRLKLHMMIFLVIMLVIDLLGIFGYLAPQPLWFKALILITLPLQVWIGGKLARLVRKKAYGEPASSQVP